MLGIQDVHIILAYQDRKIVEIRDLFHLGELIFNSGF